MNRGQALCVAKSDAIVRREVEVVIMVMVVTEKCGGNCVVEALTCFYLIKR
jgi:hypothetical protein